jgi:hypothetical protein
MGRDAVNPLEGIQGDGGRARSRIGRSLQNQVAGVEFLQCIHGQDRPCDISGLRFQRGDFGSIDRRTRINRETRMHPGQQILHEGFGKTFGLVQTQKKQAAEYLHHRQSVQRGKRQKFPVGRKSSVRNQAVAIKRMRKRPETSCYVGHVMLWFLPFSMALRSCRLCQAAGDGERRRRSWPGWQGSLTWRHPSNVGQMSDHGFSMPGTARKAGKARKGSFDPKS